MQYCPFFFFYSYSWFRNSRGFYPSLCFLLTYLRLPWRSLSRSLIMFLFFYELSIFRKFLNILVTANIISFFNVYISFIYYLSNVDECAYKKYVGLFSLKCLLVIVCLYSVLSIIEFYFSFSIKEWGFLSSFPDICRIILFSYAIFVLLFFCYIFLYPLLFDSSEIYKALIPLSTWEFYGGCSKYCTADSTCSKYFHTPSFPYSWESSSELQKGSYNIVNNTYNINIYNPNLIVYFYSLVNLVGTSLISFPSLTIYLFNKRIK